MPPVRTRRRYYEELEEEEEEESGSDVGDDADEDGMPPLVDQPAPMEFTFFTEMTPLSFDPSATPLIKDSTSSTTPFTFASVDKGDQQPPLPPPNPRSSHGKRRDASYIPRPPNAFILFRSSFIREQQVTGKVEGNHSNLSKIIGMYWKTLPVTQRAIWEAKAAAAQLEHRRRYPDWRFRPGANALVKLKVKDGTPTNAMAGPSSARRVRGAKDPPDRGGGEDSDVDPQEKDPEHGTADKEADGNAKGKGRAKVRARAKSVRGRTKLRTPKGDEKTQEGGEETSKSRKDKKIEESKMLRIQKITEMLVEGKTGMELERAVEEWDKGNTKSKDGSKKTSTLLRASHSASQDTPSFGKESNMAARTSSTSIDVTTTSFSRGARSPLSVSTASPSTSISAAASPALSYLSPALSYASASIGTGTSSSNFPHSPMSSMWSASTPATPATPDIDAYAFNAPIMGGSRETPATFHTTRRSHSRSPSRSPSPHTEPVQLTQMFKRSLSAPAPHKRVAYPRPPIPSVSMPLPTSPSTTRKRIGPRHRASASVSFAMGGPPGLGSSMGIRASPDPSSVLQDRPTSIGNVFRHGVQRMPTRARRETISSPEAPALGSSVSLPHSPSYAHGHERPHQLAHSQTYPLPSGSTSSSGHTYHSPNSLYGGYSSSSVSRPPSRILTWQQEEDRRRMEIESGGGWWWASTGVTTTTDPEPMYEPVREGSFDYSESQEEGAGYIVSGGSTSSMDQRYLEQFPRLTTEQSAATSATMDGVQWAAVAESPSDTDAAPTAYTRPNFIAPSTPSQSHFALPTNIMPTINITTNINVNVNINPGTPTIEASIQTPVAGGYFYPLPPTPISPYSSSFSTLVGWDGETRASQEPNPSSTGWGSAATNNAAGGGWASGTEWGGLQDVGLGGGSGSDA